MRKTIPTVTIGIAARNEEKNIASLIKTLLALPIKNAQLERIIVISDGSTDDTVNEVKSIKNNAILSIEHAKRKGKATRLQEVCNMTTSDILVLCDADIHIKDKNFLGKLIAPILKKDAELTSVVIRELPSKTFVGSMLGFSMEFKRELFNDFRGGRSIYTCHGRARSLSKKLYKMIDFKHYIADDAYLYFFAQKHNFSYKFVTNTAVYYRIPENITDHLQQSKRFYGSQKQFYKEFGKKNVQQTYKLPLAELVNHSLYGFIKSPIRTVAYCLVSTWSFISSKNYSYEWGTAHSTK